MDRKMDDGDLGSGNFFLGYGIIGFSFSNIEQFSETDQDPEAKDAAGETLPAPAAPHRGIAIAMLVVGVALNGYTLFSVFYTESVNKKPGVTLITSKTEHDRRLHAVVGTYPDGHGTGRPGHRRQRRRDDPLLRDRRLRADR